MVNKIYKGNAGCFSTAGIFVKQNKHYEMRFKEPNRGGYMLIKV